MSDLLSLAVHNNIHLCSAVLAPFGSRPEVRSGCITFSGALRPNYPSVITTARVLDPAELSFVAKLPKGAGVKDSYDTLDLAPFGFKKVVQAQWIARHSEPVTSPSLTKVEPEDLGRWCAAWDNADLSGQSNFTAVLLSEPSIILWATPDFKSGMVTNESAPHVFGVSNIFGELEAVLPHLPRGTIVGYETDPSPFMAFGFSPLGPLAIWIKTG